MQTANVRLISTHAVLLAVNGNAIYCAMARAVALGATLQYKAQMSRGSSDLLARFDALAWFLLPTKLALPGGM
jgi:hypothetical protein